MPRALWTDPYATQAVDLLQEPARARAEAVRQIGAANARAAEVSGNANANAQIQSGNAWAGAIQNVGQSVAALPGQIQQAQEQSRQAAMQKLQLTTMQRQSDAQQRLADTKQQVSAMMQSPDIYGEDGTINVKTLLGKMGGPLPNGASGPTQAPDAATIYGLMDPINESLLKARASANTATQHRNDVVGRMADTILQFAGTNPQGLLDNVKLGTGALIKAGVITPNQADEMLGPMVANPDAIPQILTHLKTLGAPQKAVVLKEGEQGFDPNTNQPIPGMTVAPKPDKPIEVNPGNQLVSPDGKVVYTAPPKVIDPADAALKAAQLKEINAKLTGTMPLSLKDRAELEIQRQKLAEEGAAPALSPDAIKLTARQFAMTGQLPPMGMGKTGAKVRTDIINAAADEYKGLDLPTQIAAFNANKQSLKTLQGTADKVTAFESTAGKNLDQFLALADKIPDTGIPWLNTPIRSLNVSTMGSENQAAANAARDVALREIARVTNDPNLAGVLSDSARHEVSQLVPANATFAQIKAVAKVLKQDMANVHGSLNDQIVAVQQRIATPPGGTAAPAPKALRYNPATGKVE